MVDLFELLFAGSRRAGQDELPLLAPVVHLEADGIPQFRGFLPLVDKHGGFSRKQHPRMQVYHLHILTERVRVRQIKHAFCRLFRRRGLAAPLGSLDKHRAHGVQFLRKQFVGYPRPVSFIIHLFQFITSIIMRKDNHKPLILQGFYGLLCRLALFCFGIWRFVAWLFGAKTIGNLAEVCSVKWRIHILAGGYDCG